MKSLRRMFAPGVTASLALLMTSTAIAADPPPVKLALSFKPVHRDVEIDIPKESEYGDCKVEGEKNPFGWVIYGPNGQVIRRYVDVNGDNLVDQWRYYHHGLEVYRDIDTNKNNKVDQSRWLNTGGTRWGIDNNEDGRIDSWKILSAEEATREAVTAMVSGDTDRLQAVLVDESDLDALGVGKTLQSLIMKDVADPRQKMRAAVGNGSVIRRDTRWSRFDSQMPSIVPAETTNSKNDLWVYEGAMAIVETGGNPGLVQIGEMLRVGDVWKLTQIPMPIAANAQTIPGSPKIMQPAQPNIVAGVDGGIPPELQELLNRLQELDEKAPGPTATPQQVAQYNEARANLLAELVRKSPNAEMQEQWLRQMVDGLTAAVQTGAYPKGLDRLRQLSAQYAKGAPRSPMRPYIDYRLLLADYSTRISVQKADARQAAQKWWLDQLADFVQAWPTADDTPEAMIQLAITNEFNDKLPDANKWYGQLATNHPKTPQGERAAGALRRMKLEGEILDLSGKVFGGNRNVSIKDYRGKAVLVIFWTTWCGPCTEDLPQIKELYSKYRSKGFEVLGVVLDDQPQPITEYIKKNQVPWPHIHEQGGLQSAPAKRFGIISVPTMFLVDTNGRVVSRAATVESLKKDLIDALLIGK